MVSSVPFDVPPHCAVLIWQPQAVLSGWLRCHDVATMSGEFVHEYAEFFAGKRPAIAPNNGTQSKQQQCALQTLKKNGVSLALDAAGFIPGESQVMAGVQLGVSAASFTNSLMTGTGNNAAIGATSSIVGAQITGVGMAAKSMGVSWAKAVPWIGYGVNALATLNDLSSAYGDYQTCMSHP